MGAKSFAILLTLALFVLSVQSLRRAQAATSAAANTGSEIGKIRVLEVAMMAAAAQNGADGYLSFYADDAVELPSGAPAVQGKERIRKTMDFLDDKNNRLTWTAERVDVAASGDLAYTYGGYEFHSKDQAGNATVEYGKYTTVWKKQNDGRWKVVLDMGNASPKPEGRSLR
ncbi:MAG: SgcJ/EcaC family oxidoreductase [Candidatus Acidiferrum sp.]|jgi:uncharacterized protein (TIGR02246 family)